MFETVLFPLDHSREAVEAATKALDLARSHNSRLILLSVVQSERPEMHDHAVVATLLAETQARFEQVGVSCDVVDLRILNPLDPSVFLDSIRKTGRLLVVDGGWRSCGISAEVLALVAEHIDPEELRGSLARITLPDAPAPTARVLEQAYYPSCDLVVSTALQLIG